MALLTLTNLGANAIADFMLNSDQGAQNMRFVGQRSVVTFACDAVAAGVELEIYAGGRAIQERSAIDAGGTAGVQPNLDQKAQQFVAFAGEILQFRLRETAGVATTDLNLYISVAPV